MTRERNVVVIGATLCGVTAIVNIARRWPAELPVSVLIALSTPEHPPSMVLQILEGYAPVPVAYAMQGEVAGPRRIYLSPPGYHMAVGLDGTLQIEDPGLFDSSHPSVDRLFTSAANAFGDRLIGIVLSGCARDAIQGLRDIESVGGIAISQRADDAAEGTVVSTATLDGRAHYSVKVADIAALVKRLVAAGAAAHPVTALHN